MKLIDEIQSAKLQERTRRADIATETAALDNIIKGITSAGRSIPMRSTMQFAVPRQKPINLVINSDEQDDSYVEFQQQ